MMKRPYIAQYGRMINNDNESCSLHETTHLELGTGMSSYNNVINGIQNDGTCETFTLEPSDPDDFLFQSSTYNTRSVEPGDPDDFVMLDKISRERTVLTSTIESGDPDDFLSCSGLLNEVTMESRDLEPRDPDDILKVMS